MTRRLPAFGKCWLLEQMMTKERREVRTGDQTSPPLGTFSPRRERLSSGHQCFLRGAQPCTSILVQFVHSGTGLKALISFMPSTLCWEQMAFGEIKSLGERAESFSLSHKSPWSDFCQWQVMTSRVPLSTRACQKALAGRVPRSWG